MTRSLVSRALGSHLPFGPVLAEQVHVDRDTIVVLPTKFSPLSFVMHEIIRHQHLGTSTRDFCYYDFEAKMDLDAVYAAHRAPGKTPALFDSLPKQYDLPLVPTLENLS